ncbi:MAG: hypothetical protein RLZZ324_848 [Candidatus Parcubacteria bacterium]|jgi:pimeloyl-ACP methyl ester carboxylesterase
MPKHLVLIHGMFQNPASWAGWKSFFESRGYVCHVPAFPFHDGDPAGLRSAIDPRLGALTFSQVMASLTAFVDSLPEKPVLIGHSMGGFAAQKLLNSGRGVAAVAIDSAPPVGIVSLKWSFLKANLPTINPFKGNSPCLPTVEWFHYAFCNVMTQEETRAAYDAYVVPESRNVPRTASGADGRIDFKKPHPPLLLIAGEKDHIIPASLNRKNFDAYAPEAGKKDFKEFPGRSHFICGQKGWEEVATFVEGWVRENA